MRPSCLDCARKHVSKAIILLSEAKLGYPTHAWLAVGNLSEAEDELVEDYPAMAQVIRANRLKLIAEINGADKAGIDLLKLLDELTAVYEANLEPVKEGAANAN